MNWRLKWGLYFHYKKGEEQEGTQLTECRGMVQTSKGSFIGWNLPGRILLKETNRGAILKGEEIGKFSWYHIIYTRESSLDRLNMYKKK